MNRIVELRKTKRISQIELADILGWKQARLSNYENSRRTASLDDSRAIVNALNTLGVDCTLDDVFPPADEETDKEKAA